AAVVARGMGKCCVSGAGEIKVDYEAKTVEMGGKLYHEGDWISLNGSNGDVYDGQVPTTEPELDGDFAAVMNLAAKYTKTLVRTNADTPRDARQARHFGAQGIGLCRTEHMFFEGDRIKAVREMILSSDVEGRKAALAKLLPIQRGDFEGIFEAMDGYGVTIRLLDPPLHEFVPHQTATQKELAEEMGISLAEVKAKVDSLEEFNPMLGHRGCRLGITYPEITEMQARAIIEAALAVKARGIKVFPEIMIPLVGSLKEIQNQANVINATAAKVFAEKGQTVSYKVGTMIEVPRAALVADQIAEVADFFSFGTNDLTQMTFGFSRDDAPKFLKFYKENGIIKTDPFEVLDQEGVGQLVKMGVEKGRGANPDLKVGICGEHGGEPSSVKFCAKLGMNYVSCSPYRVPIARVAAAQAAIED
ncbi:MAG: pyruvate, phosphate dikinase, partial [Muribaculaceae bacterium]|nr:pyruvate, phosphate dikinase [Muribaculaceae bacterium]